MSNIPLVLKSIRGETTDAFNRLHSICEDSKFVLEVAERYPSYPLIANQRCGAWYTDPSRARSEFIYFKSTDGHFGQWTFNLRRANLHLLPIVQASGGVVIVDSTRGGKSMPDALSKTIPLWCAVINETIMRSQNPPLDTVWDIHGKLNTPPTCVGCSEHDQMARLVPGLAETLAKSSFDLIHLTKPLRPFWVTTRSASHSLPSDCLPVVCVSASKQVVDGTERRNNNYTYVQGAADDHESWSNALTPTMFWAHQRGLLQCSRDSISETIKGIVESHCATPNRGQWQAISAVNGQMLLSTFGDIESHNDDLGLIQVQKPHHDQKTLIIQSETNRLRIRTGEGKKDQLQFLHQVLPAVDRFGRQWLNGSGRRLLIADMDANYDKSVGIMMLLLARFFEDDGQECPSDQPCEGKALSLYEEYYGLSCPQVTKNSLRRRLEWIQQSAPQANPSRTTMKRVNEYAISGLRHVHRQPRDTSLQGAQSTD